MILAHKIADRLLEIQAVRLNTEEAFTWASGLKSPLYCDNRKILSHPEIRREVLDGFIQRLGAVGAYNAIAGVATAGIAWGAMLSDRLDKPFVYVRAKAKEHGLRNMIEGELAPASQVIVIEDLISTGGSSIEACKALRQQNHEVIQVVSIFQYGFDQARENFAKESLEFSSLCDFQTLLERALLKNYIKSNEFDNLSSWSLNPSLWSENYLRQKA